MTASTTIEGIRFERLIQSSFRIRSGELVIYVDPHRVTGGDKADLVLVTHEHFDHLDPDAIAAVRKDDTVVIANAPCAQRLKGQGNVISIKEGGTVTEKGVQVRAVAGYNDFHPRGFNVGFVFTVAGKNIYHAGDTNRVPEMASMGPIDVALMPIGGTYTMDEKEAADAVRDIKPRHVIPMHYGYATGGDPKKFATLVGDVAQVTIL